MKSSFYPTHYVSSIVVLAWLIVMAVNRALAGNLSLIGSLLLLFGVTVMLVLIIVNLVNLFKWRRKSWHPGPRLY